MEIFIPTYDRVEKQTTYDNLPPYWQSRCTHVVYAEEATAHVERGRRVWVVPDHVRGIGPKRRYIHEHATEPLVVMFDDDLVFAARRGDEPTKFRDMQWEDYDNMFQAIELAFANGYIHGAVATREGGNRRTEPFYCNSRALRAHFIAKNAPATYSDRFMQDFHMTLSLLTQGYSNIILNEWVHNQSGSNSKGGCSSTRDLAALSKAAHNLHAHFPDFVKVVEKETKTSWGGGKRTDVRIQWKKAIESASK